MVVILAAARGLTRSVREGGEAHTVGPRRNSQKLTTNLHKTTSSRSFRVVYNTQLRRRQTGFRVEAAIRPREKPRVVCSRPHFDASLDPHGFVCRVTTG